jgi:hypothetical protein
MSWPKGRPAHNVGKTDPRCLPTEQPTTKDIAWAAGVYEGEGTCNFHVCGNRGTNRNGSTYQVIQMSVAQKDSWLCHRLRDLFGGAVRVINSKTGSIKNPDARCNYHRWDLSGTRALGFLQTIYIFLSPRRKAQIRLVLDQARRAI